MILCELIGLLIDTKYFPDNLFLPLPGLKLSGPDVIVKMMHMAADQNKSGPENSSHA